MHKRTHIDTHMNAWMHIHNYMCTHANTYTLVNTIKLMLGASLKQCAHTCILSHQHTQEEAAETLLATRVLADAEAEAVASAASAVASEVSLSYMYHATRLYTNSGANTHLCFNSTRKTHTNTASEITAEVFMRSYNSIETIGFLFRKNDVQFIRSEILLQRLFHSILYQETFHLIYT